MYHALLDLTGDTPQSALRDGDVCAHRMGPDLSHPDLHTEGSGANEGMSPGATFLSTLHS